MGAVRCRLLERAGMKTWGDLLFHLPRSYLDLTCRGLDPEREEGLWRVWVLEEVRLDFRKGRKPWARIRGRTGGQAVEAWFFGGQARVDIRARLRDCPRIFGRMKRSEGGFRLDQPRLLSGEEGALWAQYPSLPGIPPLLHRRLVEGALARLREDPSVLDHRGQRVARALEILHRPQDLEGVEEARRELAREELRQMMAGLWSLRQRVRARTRPPRMVRSLEEAMAGVRELWPWSPRPGQEEALKDLWGDLSGERPMLRLLTGDVGSGKTAVALAALNWVVEAGFQGVLLAPTALLAQQHAETARKLMPPGTRIRLVLGGQSRGSGQEAGKEEDLLVGTHALLTRPLSLSRLGLLVVDEQHRFGVQQRQMLLSRAEMVDLLMLSATPIPRTLLMHLYGDLPRSEMPVCGEDLRRITTRVLPFGGRRALYRWLGERIRERQLQGFVVFPRIDPDPAIPSLLEDGPEVGRLLGVPHALISGRDSDEEIQQRVAAFRRGEIRVLLATTVIEVGLDIPQAAFMVVEGSERLGLAQLHQLRGRVGRKGQNAFCCFLAGPQAGPAQYRHLQILESSRDGYELAGRDLSHRGGGEIGGRRQTGALRFRFVRFPDDLALLEELRADLGEEKGAEAFRPWLDRLDPEVEALG